jgi:hypothetical protein
MRHLRTICIVIFALLLLGCSEDLSVIPLDEPVLESTENTLKATKPMPKLIGTTIEYLNPPPYLWMGTIDFSDNEGYGIYKIAYYIEGMWGNTNASALFIREYFYVYEGNTPDDGTIYLSGINEGVLVSGSRFITNGMVEMATGPFEGWNGRQVHVQGAVTGVDEQGLPVLGSTFRLN